ncbi:hypothetical protein QQF64_014099 [Cirrhinus molitorella]|uniref:Uncharacterized protein n=1 Tax=Cirrhinus molitorella TaxID=172907 RepID=A0ABR3LX89_9TELE
MPRGRLYPRGTIKVMDSSHLSLFPIRYNTHQKLYTSKDSYLRMLCWADVSPLLIKLAYLSQKNSRYPLLFPLPVPVPAASRTCIQVPIWSTAMESVTVAARPLAPNIALADKKLSGNPSLNSLSRDEPFKLWNTSKTPLI